VDTPDDEFSLLDMLLWISFTAFPSILPFSPLSSLLTMLLLLLLLLLFYFFFFFVFSLSLLLLLLLTVGRGGRGLILSFVHCLDGWREAFMDVEKVTNLIISEGTVAILCLNNFFNDFFLNFLCDLLISWIMINIFPVLYGKYLFVLVIVGVCICCSSWRERW